MDEDDRICTPPEVRAIAEQATSTLLPSRSRSIYDKNHSDFLKWSESKDIPHGHYSETVLLAYFSEIAKQYAATTLWSKFSMLRKTIIAHGGADPGELAKVAAFLKRAGDNQTVKKASVFTRSQIEQFIRQASDKDWLHIKVMTLFGLFGACRKSELTALTINDVSDAGDHLLVRIRVSKTGPRSFVLVGDNDPNIDALAYYKRYLQLRPKDSPPRLFLAFKNGKCTRQPLGKNMIASYPKKIAELLLLSDT
jgi:integrase